MQDKEKFTVNEIADYFRVKLNAIYVWIRNKELNAKEIDGQIYVTKEELIKFILKNTN